MKVTLFFSQKQKDICIKTDLKKLNTIIVNGEHKEYSEWSEKGISHFNDAVIVWQGDKEELKWNENILYNGQHRRGGLI